MADTELRLDRFVWQRTPNDTAHPYKWDVILTERPSDPVLAERFSITHDAMSPDMAMEAFGFTKDDVSKVVNPFLILEAASARAALATAQEALHEAEGAAKVSDAAWRTQIAQVRSDAEAAAQEAAATIAALQARIAELSPP